MRAVAADPAAVRDERDAVGARDGEARARARPRSSGRRTGPAASRAAWRRRGSARRRRRRRGTGAGRTPPGPRRSTPRCPPRPAPPCRSSRTSAGCRPRPCGSRTSRGGDDARSVGAAVELVMPSGAKMRCAQVVGVRQARPPLDHQAEQRHAEVRVLVGLARPVGELELGERSEQLVAAGNDVRRPVRERRVAGEARGLREEVAQRHRRATPGTDRARGTRAGASPPDRRARACPRRAVAGPRSR